MGRKVKDDSITVAREYQYDPERCTRALLKLLERAPRTEREGHNEEQPAPQVEAA